MGKRSTYKVAMDLDEESMTVELIGVPDNSTEAEARYERIQMLVAKIILLGQTRGRPRKEASDEDQIAA